MWDQDILWYSLPHIDALIRDRIRRCDQIIAGIM